jgi:opacity protein-like surface antigen
MTKRGRWTVGIVLFLCAGATAASAQMPEVPVPQPQPHEHAVRIGLGGGMSVPVNEAGDALKTGLHGQGFLLVNFGRLLHFGMLPTLRFNLGYQQFSYKDAVTGGQGSTTTALENAESQILSGVAGLQISLLHGPVRPYLLAGVGAYRIQNSVDSAGSGIATSTTSSIKLGIDGGAGLALRLGRIDAFVEGKVQNVYSDQGLIDTKSIRVIPISFGIVF